MSQNEAVLTLTDDNFAAEVLRSPQPVLVELGARWCAPCRALAPVVAELAREYAGQVRMAHLDVDDHPRVPTRFEVRSVPTLLLFANGRVVGQLVGARPKPAIVALVQKAL
ncbi:MAG TPA: thioredoxin [Polyangia bacterium]|jgi:thioredoxin 1|nr:thioredoxin [Polyangia bacterium]